MTQHLPLIFSALIVCAAILAGAPSVLDPSAIGIAAAGLVRPAFGWGRKREQMQTFTNVGANQTAYSILPRYRQTVFGMMLQLGGTVFTKAQISRIELFLGQKSIWGPVSGAQLDNIDQYLRGVAYGRGRSDFHLPIDFTLPNVKETPGEYVGGLDLSTLPDGQLRLEVEIAGATAPTLAGWFTWGAPQGAGQMGPVMQKLTRQTFPSAPAGDFYPPIDLRGAILCREFWFGDVATAAVTAAQAEGVANVGDGVMGAVAVTARTPTGRRKLRIIEPAANAGRFAVFGPDGDIEGTGTVAVAYANRGLAFTLADGAADFVAGDGFTIDVLPLNTDQNTNQVEIKKDSDVMYFRSDRAARFEQELYGRQPLSQLFVADLLADNHIDSVIDTKGAAVLAHRLNVTAASILTLIAQTVEQPVAG
jgi:coat protein